MYNYYFSGLTCAFPRKAMKCLVIHVCIVGHSVNQVLNSLIIFVKR